MLLVNTPAALKIIDQMHDIIPDNPDALALKAGIYQSQGKLAAAAAVLSALHPLPGTYLFRGQIVQWMGLSGATQKVSLL